LTQHDALHQETLSAIERLAQLPERIVVLFMASNPLDQPQLRLDEEARAIAEMIRKSEHRDSVKLESCWAVRPLDVLQAINEFAPRIIHFSGHGSDQSEIVFQDQSGQAKSVSKEAIVETMAATSGDIRLVFFNTCYSRGQAEAVGCRGDWHEHGDWRRCRACICCAILLGHRVWVICSTGIRSSKGGTFA
jgi:hypothetical protein